MPQIINSFRNTENPLAKALTTVGDTMFGDTLTPALKREQLRAKQRENVGIEELARTFGGAGNSVNPNAASELGILSGMKPEDAAMWNVFLTGSKTGPRSDYTTNAMAGAGKYKDSAANLDLDRSNAFNMNESDNATSRFNNSADNAQDSWEFLTKPMEALVNGQPGFVQQGAAAGLGNTGGYTDKAIGVESGGNPTAKNPNSSATGLGQFIEGTWLDMMARHAPELTQGMSRDQILALRNDPTLSRTMTEYLGQENAQALQGAGLPVTDGTKYLAHFAGPGGAIKALRSPPGTPVSAIMSPDAIAANPFLQGMTTDQLVQWANRKMGGGGSPSIAPMPQKSEKTVEMLFQENLRAADMAMPGATPEQKRQWALQQISKAKSQGITVSPDGTVQIGGDAPMNLTNANMTKAQGDEMAFRRFEGTLGMAKNMIAQNPNSVGLIGQARGTAQDVGTMAQGAAQLFGIQDINAEMANARNEAARFGVNLDFEYDPAISQIESMMNILAFQGARAIGGQSGNDLSDKDVRAIKNILGDPTSLFTNQKKLLSKLELAQQYVADQRKINLSILGQAPPAGSPAPTPAAAPAGTTSKGTSWKVVQ